MAEFVEVINKSTEMCEYYNDCGICPLNLVSGYICFDLRKREPKKFEEIVMDWEKPVDWSKVEVDTKIWVSNFSENKHWAKRYFAKYENGLVYAWKDGKTSWSVNDKTDIKDWEYVKLAKEGE